MPKRLTASDAKARYQSVSAKTGVPWAFIAVAHERESSQNWNGSLAQGDPWNQESTHVPKGRGPFKSWEDAAVDALVNCAPRAALNKDWSIGGTLTMLEQYNGLGYANGPSGWVGKPYTASRKQRFPSQPSAYIWGGTDQYVAGKYVADGVYDSTVVDQQLGCAGMLLAMMSLDPSISFDGGHAPAPSAPASTVPPAKPSTPSVTNPAPGSLGDFIASIISAIFGKKK
ncbi:lysozyme family protein [Bradyrhizobium elkanii]|uniref:hypothetical protein n=1 Tax=Bradyrhizobium elkanii TaxID=29448 RepID=UPI003517E1C3